jgi:hypothetical protein
LKRPRGGPRCDRTNLFLLSAGVVALAASSPRAYAGLTALIDDATHVDGIANGRVHHPSGHLRGNWSAAIAGDSIAGALGTNAPVAPDNSAIIFRTGCS